MEVDYNKSKYRDINDYYATNPKHGEEISKILNLSKEKNITILEPCAGEGHLSEVFKKYGNVTTNDLIKRSYKLDYNFDFLETNIFRDFDYVITNPPFKYIEKFILKSLECVKEDGKVVIMGRIQLLETLKRKEIHQKYLKHVYVYSKRVSFAKGGDEEYFTKGSSLCCAWYVFSNQKSKYDVIRLDII